MVYTKITKNSYMIPLPPFWRQRRQKTKAERRRQRQTNRNKDNTAMLERTKAHEGRHTHQFAAEGGRGHTTYTEADTSRLHEENLNRVYIYVYDNIFRYVDLFIYKYT